MAYFSIKSLKIRKGVIKLCDVDAALGGGRLKAFGTHYINAWHKVASSRRKKTESSCKNTDLHSSLHFEKIELCPTLVPKAYIHAVHPAHTP